MRHQHPFRIRPAGPPRRRARAAVLAVVTALTLTTTAVGTSQAAQPDGTATRQTAATTSPTGATGATARSGAAPETSAVSLTGTHCTPTAAGSRERRAGATEACVSASPAQAAPRSRSAIAPLADASCAITAPGTYSYERFSYCVSGINVLYVLRDSKGAELGRGTLQVATSATLPKAATTWQEQVTVRMTAASGEVTALNAKLRASCSTGCTATKTAPWYGGDLVLDQSLSGSVAYSSSPAQGAAAEFTTSYKLYVTSPGATAVDPNASWDNPRKVRCDNAVGGTSPAGCAVPSVMPVVPLKTTASDPGGAVAAYDWAQKNLDGAWGTKGKPLTRATSGASGRTAATCAGFTPETDLLDNDTCGDFPFGESKEGGSAGSDCVDVIPNLSHGEWDTYVLNDARDPDPSRPCVRAHVKDADRQFAAGQLAEGFADQRVIDADQFELTLSTPDGGAQASCLDATLPDGRVPSGDGWILNTSEPVAAVNKTTDPVGKAGERPTRAQACVGLGFVKGKPAGGDITGWQDAKLYRTAQSPGTKLARCHLVPNVIGGRGNQYNLVPCWQVGMNTGTPSMRTYEAMAEKLVKGETDDAGRSLGPDDAIFYQVTPVYKDATSTIPVGVTMIATIERANGPSEQLFPNVYVTNTLENTGTLNLGN
ncbi:DNA/RNA non-specific endonuclease [Streptomyces sp. GZWMJZ-114]|uniref:DNA/RNA non-specific endonuclease n=1 Tax=Streptomyces sp. GZWMJZ-114 TaxID=2494734 RepID=UPI001013293E|nr:DNA/RNA non-specific endonuclease [Streptomyces sp. GZWMJZ-114]